MKHLVTCVEAAMRNMQHVFIALCDLGLLFLFFFVSKESRKAVNCILRHCTIDQICKYFTSTKNNNQTICFVVSQQIKKKLFSSIFMFCGSRNVCLFFFDSPASKSLLTLKWGSHFIFQDNQGCLIISQPVM